MNKDISEHVIRFMNLAEKRYGTPELKQAFVVRSIYLLFPDIPEYEIKDLIEVFINVSKLTTKILFNTLGNADCCSIF